MILASNSPRRKAILEQLGLNVIIKTKEIEEISHKSKIDEKIKEISEKKGENVAKEHPNEFVVSADTMVEIDGIILGKPKNRDDAKKMLKKISGKKHSVLTAFSLFNINKNIKITEIVKSQVYFRKLDNDEIEWYLDSGEAMDKAGSYGVQGLGAVFIERIEGDFFSIMGFPVNRFVDILKRLEINIKDLNKI